MRLLAEYQKLHAQRKFPGFSILPHAPEIASLVGEYGSRTLLDYGCGFGWQYTRERVHRLWALNMPVLYDPAVKGYAQKPQGRFDGVICTDVLECVPEDELDEVLRELAGYAAQWVFVSVCCRPSKSIVFEDGANVHVTLKSIEEWRAFLESYFVGETRLVLRQTQ